MLPDKVVTNYIIQRIVIRVFEYKPLGLNGNNQKAETVANLLGHPS